MTTKPENEMIAEANEAAENVSTQAQSGGSEDLQKQLDDMRDQWIRAVAELDNTRKRAQKDREDAHKYAATNFARDVLGVYDSLLRASQIITNSESLTDETKSIVEGISLTLTELDNIFNRQGIQKIDPAHKPFDPNFHQAMFEVPTNDVDSGTVVQVIQQGFTLHDRLLRPALVGVAKKAD